MLLADLFNTPTEIEFEGRSLKLRQPTIEEEGAFSVWLEQRAREHAERATELPPESQGQYRKIAQESAAACEYGWGSDVYVRALGTPLGVAKMLSLILAAENDRVTFDFCRRLVAQKLAEVAAVLAAKETPDPKVRAAILQSVGLPPGYLDDSASTSSSPPSTPPTTAPSAKSPG